MIQLERTYVLMGRDVACDLLAVSGVDARGLDLCSLHRLLREHCPSAWHEALDGVLVVEEAEMPRLCRRFQEEVAARAPDACGRDAGHVVQRSIAEFLHPELADRPNPCLTAALRRGPGEPVTVVDDLAVIDATIAFNRHVREHVDHGLSARAAVH